MIYGFWLLINGEKQKAEKAPKEAMNVSIGVGPKKDPYDIIKRSEIDSYFTPEFNLAYDLFEKWKMGFGLPRGLSWDEQPSFIMDIIQTLEAEYNKYKRGA